MYTHTHLKHYPSKTLKQNLKHSKVFNKRYISLLVIKENDEMTSKTNAKY